MPHHEADTTPEVEALFQGWLAERSGSERVRMACDMFDAATALIGAGLPGPLAADPILRRIAVLERLSWPERNESFIKAAIAALRGAAGPPD